MPPPIKKSHSKSGLLHGQNFSSFCTSCGKNFSSAGALHACTESVNLLMRAFFRLISHLHLSSPPVLNLVSVQNADITPIIKKSCRKVNRILYHNDHYARMRVENLIVFVDYPHIFKGLKKSSTKCECRVENVFFFLPIFYVFRVVISISCYDNENVFELNFVNRFVRSDRSGAGFFIFSTFSTQIFPRFFTE